MIKKHLLHVRELLRLEKEEDLRQYKEQIQNRPLPDRVEKGVSWYPVSVVKMGFVLGDRAFIIIERTKSLGEPHKFRAGRPINLFSNAAHLNKAERAGVVHFVKKDQMKIILNSKDIPDWVGHGSLGIDVMFDERTYVEMDKALKQVLAAKKGRIKELRSILLGEADPYFGEINHPILIPLLNKSQNEAVNDILTAEDVAIVHGPPGTGKTTTIVQAIKVLSQRENNILVCAPSNTAVDLLTERLTEQGLNVVRIGNISRVEESILALSLDGRLARHPEYKNIKKIKKDAADARRQAQKYKRNFGRQERQQRRDLYKEATELTQWANDMEKRLIDQILAAAHVITCTLVGAVSEPIRDLKFKTVFIDEAAQALEPATWIPILRANRVIFAGDPFQLAPTVKSKDAQKGGFNITLMERAIETLPSILLNTQYRMHETIMGFSNQLFYNNKLIAADSVKTATLSQSNGNTAPMEFIDTAGCGFNEILNEEWKSRYNPDEYQVLREHLYQLIAAADKDNFPSIGIISPYRQQVIHIKGDIEEDPELEGFSFDVNTIDGFQGQERDVIYISLVRSNDKGEIGFLSDTRRMNVAMTRAKKKLVIVGDSATLGTSKFYQKFLDYCEKHDAYRTAWEFMS